MDFSPISCDAPRCWEIYFSDTVSVSVTYHPIDFLSFTYLLYKIIDSSSYVFNRFATGFYTGTNPTIPNIGGGYTYNIIPRIVASTGYGLSYGFYSINMNLYTFTNGYPII